MEPNKSNINTESWSSWLASCGFLFPTNKLELSRFNMLFGENDPDISGDQINPLRIIEKVGEANKINKEAIPLRSYKRKYKLVANANLKPLPPHIIEQLKKKGK